MTDINLIRYGVVTDIDTYAFGDCTSLTSVTIGYSVAAIDSFAFKGCTSLTSIIFTSQTWDITLGYSAFSLGSSAHPVTCTVMSPDNVADGRLDAY